MKKTSLKLRKLKDPSINGISVKNSPHDSLNSSKGVMYCRDLAGISDLEIRQELAGQGAKHVQRVRVTKDSKKGDTSTFFSNLCYAYASKEHPGWLFVSSR